MGKTWTCPFAFVLFFFAFSICFLFAFVLLFFAFFQAQAKKSKPKATKKANRKSKKKATKMQMDKSVFFSNFSPFLTFLFFPFILLPVFFGFEVVLFDFPCIFLLFAFFSSLKHIRISYRGGHNCSVVGWLNISNS